MGRVASVVARANKQLSVQFAAILLASSSLLSAVLGLVREWLLNQNYYDTYKAGIDAYQVAFTVPDFMFIILVSGALSVSFIPVFNQRLASGNKKSAWEISTSLINFMAITTLIASVLIIIFANYLVNIITPGLSEQSRELATAMMRVIAVNPFLFAISTVIASMQQAISKFTIFALAPSIYNIGIVIGTVFFTQGINIFGWQVFEGGIMGVALGVVLGSVMQLIVSSLGLIGLGFDYNFKIYWRNRGFKKVLSLLPARSLDQGADYLNSMVEANLASRMPSGTIRAYASAITVHNMPINLIGIAISTAAFPQMTDQIANGEKKAFWRGLHGYIRAIVFLVLPIAAITYFGRGFVINFIKTGGDQLMADILGGLALAIVFRCLYHPLARVFYAHQNTKTPLIVSVVAIGFNIIVSIIFTLYFNFGVMGLAWAQSLTALLEVLILGSILQKRYQAFDREFASALAKMFFSMLIMSVFTYVFVQSFQLKTGEVGFWITFPKFMLITLLSFSIYLFVGWRLKLVEVSMFFDKIKKYFMKY